MNFYSNHSEHDEKEKDIDFYQKPTSLAKKVHQKEEVVVRKTLNLKLKRNDFGLTTEDFVPLPPLNKQIPI